MCSEERLPSDLIFEILTRITSLETLDRCKSVSKSWNKMIHESRFMPIYCQRTKNLSGYLIVDKDMAGATSCWTKFVSIDQLQELEKGVESSSISTSPSSNVFMEGLFNVFKIVASCNQGILCCERRRYSNSKNYWYYVCKPTTKQPKLLPMPNRRYETAAVAIMVLSSSPLRYKIVRLCVERSTNKYKCEIFDSKIWTWKETKYVNLSREEYILGSSTTVSTSNSIYWLTTHENVLAFHEPEGTFQKFPLPEEVVQDKKKYSFTYNYWLTSHENELEFHEPEGTFQKFPLPEVVVHYKKKFPYKYKKLMEHQGRLALIICNAKKKGDTELWIMYENPRNCTNWTKKMEMQDIESTPSLAGFYKDVNEFLKAFHDVVLNKTTAKTDCRLSVMEMDYELSYKREVFRFRSDLEPVSFEGNGDHGSCRL